MNFDTSMHIDEEYDNPEIFCQNFEVQFFFSFVSSGYIFLSFAVKKLLEIKNLPN